MTENNSDTKQILDAIKNMMSNNLVETKEELPKDIIELTSPIKEETINLEKKDSVLELTELVSINDDPPVNQQDNHLYNDNESIISEDHIREIVKKNIESYPVDKLELIINEELTKAIKNKIINAKIIIASKDEKK